MKLFKNTLFVFAVLMAGSQVQAMDFFDFGDDVVSSAGAWADSTLESYAQTISAAAGEIEVSAETKAALEALLVVNASDTDFDKVMMALNEYIATNLEELNKALEADAGANPKDIMGKSLFAVTHGVGIANPVIVQSVMAWKSIIQTTISTVMLNMAAEAHKTKTEEVLQLRLRYDSLNSQLSTVQVEAKSTHAQIAQALKGLESVKRELTNRLAIASAAYDTTSKAASTAKTIGSAK